MNEKRVEFNRDNSKTVNTESTSKNNMNGNPDTKTISFLKYQTISVNYWGEGPFDDELVLSYDF